MREILNSLIGKILVGIAGGAIAIAVVFFFLWTLSTREAEREREARLAAEDGLAKTEEELVRYASALNAAESRNAARQGAREGLRDDEARILEMPATRDCVASPAISDALGRLREHRAGDTSEPDNPE